MPESYRGQAPNQRGSETIVIQMTEAKSKVVAKPQCCLKPNQHARMKTDVAANPIAMEPMNSAVWRWSP